MARRSKPEWLRECVLAGKQFNYKTKNHLKHNALNLSVFAAVLAVIVATCAMGTVLTGLPYVLAAMPILSIAFFCLYVLVIHEASHGMFVLAEGRQRRLMLNRIFAWPVSLFFFTHYGKLWEVGHLEHHVRPIEENDPQQLNRITGPRLFLEVGLLLLIPGYAFFQRVFLRSKLQKEGSSWWVPPVSATIFAGFCALAWVTVGWWVSLGILMGLQGLSALNEIKGALEHGGAIAHHPEPLMRSRTSLFVGRHILMPLNISMHFEHHLNHTVPWYELMNYHRAIKPLVPEVLRDNLFNRDILAQLLGGLDSPIAGEPSWEGPGEAAAAE